MISEPDKSSIPVIHECLSCELLLTTFCNMKCVYCIAGDLPGSTMSIEAGQKAIDMFVDLAQGAKYLEIIFTGGEPLLEFTTLKNLTHYAQQRTTEVGTDINFVIKTNGTILDSTIIEFLNAHRIKLVISIDGTGENHDRYRKNSAGNGTHHIVSRNLRTVLQNDIACVASITVHPSLHKTAIENVRYLHKLGVEQIDLGPAYGTVLWTESDSLALAQSIYDVARYIRDVADTGQKLEVGPIYQESKHVGGILSDHWGCGAASTNIAFMPNGQITGCSALAMLTPRYPELVLGDVWKGLDNHAVDHLLQLAQAGLKKRLSCQRCETATNCTGGCLAMNYSTTGSPLTPPEFYCKTMYSIPNAWQIAWAENNTKGGKRQGKKTAFSG